MGGDSLIKSETNKYYIVEVTLRECKDSRGTILTEEGSKAYLGWTKEGGGWPAIVTNKLFARRFLKVPSKKTIYQWDGMPWYNNIREVNKIIEVVEYHSIREKFLTNPEKENI